jgi:hypothetical protein
MATKKRSKIRKCRTVKRAAKRPTDATLIKEWCVSHGITKPAHQKAMQLGRVTREEATTWLGFEAPADGTLIVYPGLDGTLTRFFRIRFDDYDAPWSKVTGQKPMRYAQPPNSGVQVYFAPLVDWIKIAKDVSIRLLITEGEATHKAKPKTVKYYRQGAEMLKRSNLSELRLDELTSEHVGRFAAEFSHLSPSGINTPLQSTK